MKRTDSSPWGIAAAVMVGCALLARGLMPFVSDSELQVLARQLEGTIAQTEAVVHARAVTLAEMRQLGFIVYTDADTARDMSRHDLNFQPAEHETIDVRQWFRGKPPLTLVHVPVEAPPIGAPDAPGVYMRPARHGMAIIEVTEVRTRTRSEEPDKLGGALLVSRDLDLEGLSAQLEGARSAAWLESGGQEVPLTRAPRTSGTSEARVPLGELGGRSISLVMQRRTGAGRWLWLLGAGFCAFVAAFLTLRRLNVMARPKPEVPPARRRAKLPPAVLSSTRSTTRSTMTGSTMSTMTGSGLTGSTMSQSRSENVSDSLSGARRIGRYALIKQLGTGGMADVFLARAEGPSGFEKLVALKVLKPEIVEEQAVVDHLIIEARLSSLFNHPNVVETIDLGVAEDCYIAMEYVDGADLRKLHSLARLRQQPVPLSIVFSLLRSICDGLHAAHNAVTPDGNPLGLIHRDVKLANVLVGRNGVIKVSDFGIAQADPVFRGFATMNGEIKGTMAYMAPEQRLGGSIDVRVDVYGVGIIAYQLLSGTRLNLDVIRLRSLSKEGWPHLPPLLEFRRDLPAGVDEIVQRAMAYSANDRYANCEELDTALGELAGRHDLVASRREIARWVQAMMARPLPTRAAEVDLVLPLIPVVTATVKNA